MTSTAGKKGDEAFDTQNEEPDWHNTNVLVIPTLKVKEEMSLTIHTLEEALKETRKERDKTLHQLDRLKQHLLDKEQEDSEKMDEDTKMIEELRANCEYQKNHILQLERALKQEIAKREDIKKLTNDELQKSNEIIHDLKQKLTSCMSALESKNIELVNLQTALGQYYAESEAKERLGRDLASAREELSKVSESLKVANQQLELSIKEKEEIAAKLSQSERILAEGRHSMQKLEEDNSRLRRALEQSMTTLNRMSLDSDNYVDRRIVIKLLVTYFQRNHSKEVLDLMVRMLGFSEEDKQRIGFAQHAAGKGVVRGVLGLPGRLVGGILGGHSQETSTKMPSENQSFADLWVDFLLKETEERERRESAEASRVSSNTQEKSTTSPSTSNASNLPLFIPQQTKHLALQNKANYSNTLTPNSRPCRLHPLRINRNEICSQDRLQDTRISAG
uniref:Golgin candidate 4 n=1 Tax=Ananas comosus var. bracteatus TaxID=296719 RepID=A0A6V7QYN4_ANACO